MESATCEGQKGVRSLTWKFGPSIGARSLPGGSHGPYRPFHPELKHPGKASEKYSDGRWLYLLVKESNKYWRMNYRYEGKHKTLALGIYPEVSLEEARDLLPSSATCLC